MTDLSRSQVRLSKRLSLILRHRPESAGISIDRNGWADIPAVLAALDIGRDELDAVVAGNDKSRFAVEGDRIRADGLRPGRRHHVHLSPDTATALRVGRRRSADVVVLEVAAADMADAGHVFHLSANGVWLTDAVPPRYLRTAPLP